MLQPVVGVVPLYDEERKNYWMLPGYMRALENAGAVPVMLPLSMEEAVLDRILDICDGILFTGGQDLEPARYGQKRAPGCGRACPERDAMEIGLFHRALERNVPAMGICRGLQLFNVCLGGNLYQDLPEEAGTGICHCQKPPYHLPAHLVSLTGAGFLPGLLRRRSFPVNSYHHQGVNCLAPGLIPMALAEDGLVEAAFLPEARCAFAVQWHPEYMPDAPESPRLFAYFTGQCAERLAQGLSCRTHIFSPGQGIS